MLTNRTRPNCGARSISRSTAPGRAAPADSITPERAAEIAFDGALHDRPLILTHSLFAERAKARFDEAIARLSHIGG